MQADNAHAEHGHGHHHVTPFWTMLFVFIALVFLTVVTVLTAKYVHIPGHGNLILALFIACTKGLLVAGFFMHLVYDDKMNTVVGASTIFCVALFLGFTLLDLSARDSVDRLQGTEIVAGGSKQHVKTVIESAHAAEGNHDGEHAGDGEHGDDAAHAGEDQAGEGGAMDAEDH